jgi:hypothetical protein
MLKLNFWLRYYLVLHVIMSRYCHFMLFLAVIGICERARIYGGNVLLLLMDRFVSLSIFFGDLSNGGNLMVVEGITLEIAAFERTGIQGMEDFS